MTAVEKFNENNPRGPARSTVKTYDSGWVERISTEKGTKYFIDGATNKASNKPPKNLGNLLSEASVFMNLSEESFSKYRPPGRPPKEANCKSMVSSPHFHTLFFL